MPSAFARGRSAPTFDPVRLEYSSKAGTWTVVHVQPSASGGYSKDVTQLQLGQSVIPGTHCIYHGYVTFTPSFDQQLRPWAPEQPPMPPPQGWASPVEALKFPLLVDRFGPLWLMVTSVIAMNSLMAMLEEWSSAPEFQEGQLPICELAESRPIKIKDRPGETFYAPALSRVAWCQLEQTQLGTRVTPILPPVTRPKRLAPHPVQEPIKLVDSSHDLPWEDVPQPKPLPEVSTGKPPSADPFDVFRRS
jgi:hypothetical protein